MAKVLTINDLYKSLAIEKKKGNGTKKILLATDDEGNGFRPMFFAVSPTEGNVDYCTLYYVDVEDAKKNYVIIG